MFSGRVRSRLCIWARLSIWKVPTVSARWISANTSRVVERDAGEVDRRAVGLRDLLDALLDGGEHPEPEQVDLEEAGVGAGVLVPLAELAARHRRGLHGHEVDQRPRRDHHPARVLGDVARQAGDLGREELERAPALRDELALGVRERGHLLGDAGGVPAVGEPREPLELGLRQAERLADVADRAARAVGREARDERGVLVAVALGDGDDQLLADVAREVEVDVRDRGQLAVEEAAEREVVRDRVDVREAGQVADDRADRAAAAAARAAGSGAASRGRAPAGRTPARARAPPSGGGRSRPARARRSARARSRGARAPARAGCCRSAGSGRRTRRCRSPRAAGSPARRRRRSRDSGSRAPR